MFTSTKGKIFPNIPTEPVKFYGGILDGQTLNVVPCIEAVYPTLDHDGYHSHIYRFQFFEGEPTTAHFDRIEKVPESRLEND